MTALLWITAAACVLGNVLVIRKNRWGFGLWMVCNSVLVWRNATIGENAQAALFAVYLALAAWGFWTWKSK